MCVNMYMQWFGWGVHVQHPDPTSEIHLSLTLTPIMKHPAHTPTCLTQGGQTWVYPSKKYDHNFDYKFRNNPSSSWKCFFFFACKHYLLDNTAKQTLWWGSPSLGSIAADRRRPAASTRFTACFEDLQTLHAATWFGNKTQMIKCPPPTPTPSTCHIFRSLNLHGIYEYSQGKQKKQERDSQWRGLREWRSLIILLWIAHVRQ